jgi:hypothetical protein
LVGSQALLDGINARRKARGQPALELKAVLRAEEKRDGTKARILVDLETRVAGGSTSHRVSSYLVHNGIGGFCQPENVAWDPSAMVNIVVPVHNQGAWVKHLLENLAYVYKATQDANVRLVLVDYGSTDIDLDAALENSGIPNVQLVRAKGAFSRAEGVQLGIDAVKNANEIVFTGDLHLEIPPYLMELVRMHTLRGYGSYNPIVVRLDCGAYPDTPRGFWEILGYGIFAMYKDDFVKIGGMNTREFKQKWGACGRGEGWAALGALMWFSGVGAGGEDWEMLDRVIGKGYDCDRSKVAGFYHYYHSKSGMWGSKHPLLEKSPLAFDALPPKPGARLHVRGCTAEYVRDGKREKGGGLDLYFRKGGGRLVWSASVCKCRAISRLATGNRSPTGCKPTGTHCAQRWSALWR